MKILFLAFCILHFHAQCQNTQNKQLKEFFSYAIDSVVAQEVSENTILIISSQTSNIAKMSSECMKFFDTFSDTLFVLKKADIDSIVKHASSDLYLTLTYNDFNKSKFLLSNDSKRGVSQNETYCTLSNPIFLQDYTYCLFAYDVAKGGGQTILFKKDESKWKVFKRFCAWYE